ncbi:pyridoxal phosphate-dependent aminotransferase [bacterium]|nr:pyridoxal phosphate-dependent aminotransferase [candidate division CSSED10-310 bacterium]
MENSISRKIGQFMEAGSWIRRMFEQGAELKARYGAENVFDFSIGNPMGEPPDNFINALKTAVSDPTPGLHGYMPNAGYPHVRKILAEHLSGDHGVSLTADHLIMTVGAAGALNVALKALVNAGESVLIFAPYFVEYRFYADNVNANAIIVETDQTFNLDIDAIENVLEPGVKALIINTPNNPTGRVYSESTLTRLAELLDAKSEAFGHPIYLLSDEPYKRIVYDGIHVPSLLQIYKRALICTSYSKELSIPGERLGYIAVNPDCPGAKTMINALTFCNRILGFVNAPALMQRALGLAIDAHVDIAQYQNNRDIFLKHLRRMGYEVSTPEGAFYLFVRSPIEDDVAFVAHLAKEKILAVPGQGFGRSGFFRLSYCVTSETIENAMPGFERVIRSILS